MSLSSALSNESSPSLLVIIVDIESLLAGLKVQHGQQAQRGHDHTLDMNFVITSLATFATTYGLMNRNNRLCILAFSSYGIDYILPSKESLCLTTQVMDFTICLHALNSHIRDNMHLVINNFLENEQHTPENIKMSKRERSLLSSAMSTAITLVHRQRQLGIVDSRILILDFDKQVPQNYNAVMNCIFSAKKLDTMIDALVLSSSDSHLLQQASFLTGGLYKKHADWGDLQLLLQSYFVADKITRSLLLLPTQEKVDFKASCHCHQKPVDFAYMCSVCLTLVCEEPADKCCVCHIPVRPKYERK